MDGKGTGLPEQQASSPTPKGKNLQLPLLTGLHNKSEALINSQTAVFPHILQRGHLAKHSYVCTEQH